MGFFDDLNSQLRDLTLKATGADEHVSKLKKKLEPIQQTQKEYQTLKNTVKGQTENVKNELGKIVKAEPKDKK